MAWEKRILSPKVDLIFLFCQTSFKLRVKSSSTTFLLPSLSLGFRAMKNREVNSQTTS
jgi:hypothetical protein